MAIPRSESEIVALEKFRAITQDLELGDGVLMRFLRARNLDQEKAEQMIRKFVIWREQNEVNQFHDWISPIDFSIYDGYLTGLESEGRAVFWFPYGYWPYFRSLLDDGFEKEVSLFLEKRLDNLYQLFLRTKHQQFFTIIDSEGITLWKIFYEIRNWKVFEVLKKFLIHYEAHYPEILHKAYMINTPTEAMWIWKIVKPFLSGLTISNVHFYGSSISETERWKADLFKDLPEHVIPEKYGGSAELTLITGDRSDFTQFGLKE